VAARSRGNHPLPRGVFRLVKAYVASRSRGNQLHAGGVFLFVSRTCQRACLALGLANLLECQMAPLVPAHDTSARSGMGR
jgi:hypothetical protein